MQDNRVPHHQPLDGKAQRGKKERKKKADEETEEENKMTQERHQPIDSMYTQAKPQQWVNEQSKD